MRCTNANRLSPYSANCCVMCRCMELQERWRCTFGLTRCRAAVRSATKRSPVRGCSKVIYALTPASVLSSVRTVSARSPTGRTCALTCRLTPVSRDTAVRRVANRSVACRCWPSITRLPPATATSPVQSHQLLPRLPADERTLSIRHLSAMGWINWWVGLRPKFSRLEWFDWMVFWRFSLNVMLSANLPISRELSLYVRQSNAMLTLIGIFNAVWFLWTHTKNTQIWRYAKYQFYSRYRDEHFDMSDALFRHIQKL